MPEEAWIKIMAWYGLTEEQAPIERRVIELGMFVKHCKVEVYLLEIKMCENPNDKMFISKYMSRANTIGDLEKEMRVTFDIPDDKEVRLWYKYMPNTYEHLTNKKDDILQNASLYSGQVILIKQKSENGTWPRQAKSNYTSYTSSTSVQTPTAQAPKPIQCEMCMTACGNEYCLDCTQYFCSKCKLSHLRIAVCKSHRFKSSGLATSDPTVFCQDHNEAYVFICDECQLPVCKKCIVKTHTGHVMADIIETVAARKFEFMTLVKSALPTEDLTKLNNITIQLDNHLSNITENEAKTVRSIREEGKAIKHIVDEIVDELEKNVREETQNRKKELENCRLETEKAQNSIEDIRNKEEKIKTSSETIGLLSEIKKLSGSISEFKIQIPTLRQPSTLTFQPAHKSKEAFRDIIGGLVSSCHDSDSDTKPL